MNPTIVINNVHLPQKMLQLGLMNDQTKTIAKWLGAGSINIFGLPFSGKDTQAQRLADELGGVVFSGGDIMRRSKDNPEVQRAMAGGGIVPSGLFEKIVLPHLSNPETKNKPLILSEVGRMDGEQQVIMKVTASSGHATKAVIFLTLPKKEVYARFEAAKELHDRGERQDDHREVLKTRIEKFQLSVIPVIEWYREKSLLIEIDGTLSRDEIAETILVSLENRASI